jgi:hypothetical protein
MSEKNGKRPILREGEPSQRTKAGLDIPIPKRDDIDEALSRVAGRKGPGKREKPSRSG